MFQEEVQFESTCTRTEHVTHKINRWSKVGNLSYNNNENFLLPAVAATSTQWKVYFRNDRHFNFAIIFIIQSLDVKFRAAFVRLFAVLG